MALHHRTRKIVTDLAPDEVILDGGPAKSKVLDRRAFDRLEDHFGGVSGLRQYAKSRGAGFATFMEAEWVATDQAFYYVHVNAGTKYRWPWSEIQLLPPSSSGWFGRTVPLTIGTNAERLHISVSRRAAKLLQEHVS